MLDTFTSLPGRSRAFLAMLEAMAPAQPPRNPGDARKAAVAELIAFDRADATWSVGRLLAYSEELAAVAALASGPDRYAVLNPTALRGEVGSDRISMVAGLAGFYLSYDGRWVNRDGEEETASVTAPVPEASVAFRRIAENFDEDDY